MPQKKEITFKKSTFDHILYPHGKEPIKKPVKGIVLSSGIGISKIENQRRYRITQLSSGYTILEAATEEEAREKAQRLSRVANWHKPVKPDSTLAQKVRAIDKGEKLPQSRTKDEYELSAYSRQRTNGHHPHRVEHRWASGYKGQQKERGVIRHNLRVQHIGYTIQVENTTKHHKIK